MHLIKTICLIGMFAFAGLLASDVAAQDDNKGKGKRARQGQQTEGEQGRRGRRGNPIEMLKRMDANGDSVITLDEVPDRWQQRFSRMDLDGSGAIEAEEIEQIAARLAQRSGKGKGKRRGKRGQRPEGSEEMEGPGEEGAGKGKGKKRGKRGKRGDGEMNEGEEGADSASSRRRRRGPMNMATLMDRVDADGDGQISRDEFPERMAKQFDRFDADSNEILDAEELERMAKVMQDGGGKKKRGDVDGQPRSGVQPKRPGSDG